MKKFSIAIVIVLSAMFANVVLANPNDKADEYSDPNVKVVVTYTAPDAQVTPATTPKVDPAPLVDALHLQNKFRRMDNNVSSR